MNSGNIIRSEVLTITPDFATSILERTHERNRSVSMAAVNALAEAMQLGRFNSLNGESIIIHEDGRLLDGQHRLWAVCMAGVTLPFLVVTVTGDADEVMKSIDNGRRRTTADFFAGTKHRNLVAGIGKAVYCIEEGTVPLLTAITLKRANSNRTPDRYAVIDYVERHIDELTMLATDAMAIRKNIGAGSATMIGTALYLFRHYGAGSKYRDVVDEMKAAIPKTVTAQAAIGNIRKAFMNGSKLLDSELCSRILWACDGIAAGGTVSKVNGSKVMAKYAQAVRDRKMMGGAR